MWHWCKFSAQVEFYIFPKLFLNKYHLKTAKNPLWMLNKKNIGFYLDWPFRLFCFIRASNQICRKAYVYQNASVCMRKETEPGKCTPLSCISIIFLKAFLCFSMCTERHKADIIKNNTNSRNVSKSVLSPSLYLSFFLSVLFIKFSAASNLWIPSKNKRVFPYLLFFSINGETKIRHRRPRYKWSRCPNCERSFPHLST